MTGSETEAVTDVAALHQRLQRRGETVAVAESLTGGLLAAALTETPGSSLSFRGGLVVYATDLKARLGGVPPDVLAAQGPVSPEVAVLLARHVRTALGATYGVALTGVAGPSEQDGKPVGLVYIAVTGPGRDGPAVERQAAAGRTRSQIRGGAVADALALLEQAVPEA